MNGLQQTSDIGLTQYRGTEWPVLGDFAAGFMTQNSENVDWRFHVDRYSGHNVVDIETPIGGFYAWYRNW